MYQFLTRREWLSRSALIGMVGWLSPGLVKASQEKPQVEDYNIYFGDLHNHNSVGYARGSLGRTFEIARNHLDFFAFTPHGYWHDIGHYEHRTATGTISVITRIISRING